MKHYWILLLFLSLCFFATVNAESQAGQRVSVVIELSGESFFPDGIAAQEDGTLFVGSMWSGQIDKVNSGTLTPFSFVPPEEDGRTVLGLLVDEDTTKLWAVFWDFQGFMTIPAQLKAFDLKTGALLKAYDYPEGVIGNDLTMDAKGNIYTTCSFTHRIFRLPEGGNALEVWSEDPLLAAGHQEGWTLNGIDWNGEDSVYLSRTDNNGIYRILIEDDGSAGLVEQIVVEDELSDMGYDGIVALNSDSILLTEYATSRLTMIDISETEGVKRVISTDLDFPTNAVTVGEGVWVVESQINHLLFADEAGPQQVPFKLKYLLLP